MIAYLNREDQRRDRKVVCSCIWAVPAAGGYFCRMSFLRYEKEMLVEKTCETNLSVRKGTFTELWCYFWKVIPASPCGASLGLQQGVGCWPLGAGGNACLIVICTDWSCCHQELRVCLNVGVSSLGKKDERRLQMWDKYLWHVAVK